MPIPDRSPHDTERNQDMFLMIIVAAATGILIGLGLSRLAMFLGMRG